MNFFWQERNEQKNYRLVNWKVISIPKAKGQLAIGNIVAQNITLLKMWLWRFPIEHNSSWHSIIKNKQGVQANGKDTVNPLHQLIYSMGIHLSYIPPFLHLLSSMGNGESFQFWEDAWLGDSSFDVFFTHFSWIVHSILFIWPLQLFSHQAPIS